MFEQNMGYESKHQRVGLKAIAHQMWQKDRIIEEVSEFFEAPVHLFFLIIANNIFSHCLENVWKK